MVKWGRRRSTVAMCAATSSNSLVDYKNTKERNIRDTSIHAKEPTAIALSRQMQTLLSTRIKPILVNLGLLARVAKLLTSSRVVVKKVRIQVAGGIWDTAGAEFVLTFGVAYWSISTAFTHVAAKFGLQFLLVLSFMGISEAFAMHAMNNILSKWIFVTEKRRSLALLYNGMYLGSVMGLVCYALLIHRFGWPSVFYRLGSLEAVWVALWRKAPLYWDLYAPKGLNSARNFFTFLNFEYQGTAHVLELESCGLVVPRLNIPDRVQDHSAHDHINPVKGALVYSNIVTTVSPTYAQEVRTSQVCCITILVPQKGLHLTRHAIYRMLELGGQLVLLGSCPVPHIQGVFEELVNHFKDHPNVRVILEYDEVLANSINAASDMFIMRSIFEPYGLTQMIAMRFVSVPIVRKTGGLNDSVFDVDDDTVLLQFLYGFTFLSSDEQGVNCALDPAFNLYMKINESWQRLVMRNMKIDFTWDASAAQYVVELYEMFVARARAATQALTPFKNMKFFCSYAAIAENR